MTTTSRFRSTRTFGTIGAFILTFLFLSPSIKAQTGGIHHWELVVEASGIWNYTLGTEEPPSDWNQLSFDDTTWEQGPGGIGYGDGDDLTVIQPVNSVYMRQTFQVPMVSDIQAAIFSMDYDDGFVAYLNGVEIARGNMEQAAQWPSHEDQADFFHEAELYQGGIPESFIVPNSIMESTLLQGENVLAIQVHNYGSSSSDLSAIPFLFFGTSSEEVLSELPVWFDAGDLELFTHLPLIRIETNGQAILNNQRIQAHMSVYSNDLGELNNVYDLPSDYDGDISIEIRGNSSTMFEKKSYSLETQTSTGENNNVSLLGLPAENDWVFYGPYSDKTMMRNAIVYQLSREMGWYASRQVYFELIINGDYRGLYILGEKIKRDASRVDIDSMDENDNQGDSITGGYIVKIDWPDDGENQDWYSPVTSYDGDWLDLGYQYEYPSREDMTPAQEDYIQSVFSDFEQDLISTSFQDLESGFRRHIDMHSFADHLILNEISYNVDAFRLSNFYHKVRESKGGRIFAGPVWDYNLGFGNVDFGVGWETYGWALENPWVTHAIPFHLKRMKESYFFERLLRCRWDDLRTSTLSEGHIESIIDSIAGYLGPAIDRNFERWDIIGTYVWPNYFIGESYSEEVDYLKDYINERLSWIDANLPGEGLDCASSDEGSIIISEIDFKQGETSDDPNEWIELHNRSSATVDLSGWVIKDGNNLNSFTIPLGITLASEAYLVICRHLNDFQARFPQVDQSLGSFNWKLGDSEHLRVYDDGGILVTEVQYQEVSPWPEFGAGSEETATLEILDESSEPNDPFNWFIGCPYGSPGMAYDAACAPLDLDEMTELHIKVFPNPVSDELTIAMAAEHEGFIELFSVDGRLHYRGRLQGRTMTLDLSGLSSGLYHLKMQYEGGIHSQNIVKR